MKFWVVFFGAMVVVPSVVWGHDWTTTPFKNKVGENCCGEGDCFRVNAKYGTVKSRNADGSVSGYFIQETIEFVLEEESLPSPDSAYWRCQRPDGTLRCFFAPTPAG